MFVFGVAPSRSQIDAQGVESCASLLPAPHGQARTCAHRHRDRRGPELAFSTRPELFARATSTARAALATLLRGVAPRPAAQLHGLDLLSSDERAAAHGFNETAHEAAPGERARAVPRAGGAGAGPRAWCSERGLELPLRFGGARDGPRAGFAQGVSREDSRRPWCSTRAGISCRRCWASGWPARSFCRSTWRCRWDGSGHAGGRAGARAPDARCAGQRPRFGGPRWTCRRWRDCIRGSRWGCLRGSAAPSTRPSRGTDAAYVIYTSARPASRRRRRRHRSLVNFALVRRPLRHPAGTASPSTPASASTPRSRSSSRPASPREARHRPPAPPLARASCRPTREHSVGGAFLPTHFGDISCGPRQPLAAQGGWPARSCAQAGRRGRRRERLRAYRVHSMYYGVTVDRVRQLPIGAPI